MTALQQNQESKDSLKAAFEDKPALGTGQCPIQQREIAIFPVRYAIDQALENLGEPGPDPTPENWQGQSLPKLHNRTYTLRQLRDGWLYVVDRTAGTLDEYQVQGAKFCKTDGEGSGHLLYPREHNLLLAYSSVEWTRHTRERMADSANQTRWMRSLNLASYTRTLKANHGGALKTVADFVADIDSGAALAGLRFDSTTVPSEPTSEDQEFKAALGDDTVLGNVPDQDSAIFIALDDPLGILDDLSMQAAGPAQALAQFEAEHLHRLITAQYVEMLSGADFSDLETMLCTDENAFYAFKQKAQRYLDAKLLQHIGAASGSTMAIQEATKLRQGLATEYGEAAVNRIDTLTEQWHTREMLRSQVRFKEAQQYSLEKRQEMAALQVLLTSSLEDLTAWLERLGTDPLCIFHDQVDEEQCLNLIENADAWLTLLSQDRSGHEWFVNEYAKPRTLVGLAHYNFDEELVSAIEQLVKEFTEERGIRPVTAGSMAKRSQEVVDVLSNDAIRNSSIFQRLSKPAQRAYDTLIKVASTHFDDLWEAFEYKLLPAVSARHGPQWKIIGFATVSVAVQSVVDETRPYLILDPDYSQKHASWSRQVNLVARRLEAQSRVARAGGRHDRMAASRDVQHLQRQLNKLTLEMPSKVLLRGEALVQSRYTGLQQRAYAIETLGRAQLVEQLEAKTRDYGTYMKKVNDWIKNNVNKGLAGIVTVLNIWNFHTAMSDAGASGEWTKDDQLSVGGAAATMLSGLTALNLMPAWARIAQLSGVVQITQGKNVKMRLAGAASAKWLTGHEHSALFKTFAVRAVAMSGLAVIASVVEGQQVWGDVADSKGADERKANLIKLASVASMGFLATAQLTTSIAASLGIWSAGAVFAPWILVGFVVTGAVYLAASLISDSLKRDGFKLWLHRSSWSRADTGYWPDTEEGTKDELRALQEVLLRPTILAKTLKNKLSDRDNPNRGGIWLKVVLPPDLTGNQISINPVMVSESGWFGSDHETPYRAGMYAQYFSEGNWVRLDQVGEWDSLDVREYRGVPPAVYQNHGWRVWLVHLPYSKGMNRMELEILYPGFMLKRPDNLGYRFTIDLDGMQAGTLHENPYINGHVTEPDESRKKLVIDTISRDSRQTFNLGVI